MVSIELIICENCELYSFIRKKRNCVICGQFMCKKTYTKDELIDFGFECPQCDEQFDYEYLKPVFYNNGQTQAVICKSCWERKKEPRDD
ncbi:hypothetical protein ES705_37916 [subsurface metagenome]